MCYGLVGVCCFFVWDFCCCCWGFFGNFFFTHHFVCSSQKQKKMMVLLHIPCFVQELWNSRSHPKGRLSPGWAHLGMTYCPGECPSMTSPGMSLQLVLAGDPGYQQAFPVARQPPKTLLSALKEWQKCNSQLARASPIPQGQLALRH